MTPSWPTTSTPPRCAAWLDAGLRILRLALDTHLITSHFLLPLLIEQSGGLLVEVTDGTTEYNATTYRLSAFYDLAKVGVNRLAFSQGHELAPHAPPPSPEGFAQSESPRFVGRGVAALAADPERARWNPAIAQLG